MSDSLWPLLLQHTRLSCPALSPRDCSNLCSLCRWCHPTISSSVTHFFFCPQSFPISGSFPMSQLFASGVWSIGASASAPVLPMNIQDQISFRIDWFDLLAIQGTLQSSPATLFKSINSLVLSLLYGPTLTCLPDYWKYWRNHRFDYMDLCQQSDAFAF